MGSLSIFSNNNTGDFITCQVAYPITESEAKLEKIITKEYECPVCLNFSCPPIMMCINSHIICGKCWGRCINCPTCRVPKSLTRAITLEKIHPLITFPCKWEGCSFVASASYTQIHEQYCKYFPINCPLGDCHQCDWEGTMLTIQEHLRDKHLHNVAFSSEMVLRAQFFTKSRKKDFTVIFVVDDQLFKLHWYYDLTLSPMVKFSMITIGSVNPVVEYKYSVIFAKRFPIDRDCRKLKLMKCDVKRSYTDCSIVNRDTTLRNEKIVNHEHHFAELAKYCRSGDLYYQIIIELNRISKYKKINV